MDGQSDGESVESAMLVGGDGGRFPTMECTECEVVGEDATFGQPISKTVNCVWMICSEERHWARKKNNPDSLFLRIIYYLSLPCVLRYSFSECVC